MAWHRIDYDGIWSSDKLNRCSDEAQVDYVWLYGIADAYGCFEITNLRVVHSRVAAIRKELSPERVERDFEEYRNNGLCFTWQESGKCYAYWTGCESRLPPRSAKHRYAKSTPTPPREQLDSYVRSYGGKSPQPTEPITEGERFAQPQPIGQRCEASLDVVATTSRLHRDNGNGTVTVTERKPTHTPSRPAAAVCASGTQPFELQPEGEQFAQPQPESQRAEPTQAVNPRVLFEIYEQEHGPLPAVKAETAERLSKCRKRILSHAKSQEGFLADFRVAIRKASQITWPAWRPCFDWFIANDTNYAKVLEGNYDRWKDGTTHSGGNESGRGVGKAPAHSTQIGIPIHRPNRFNAKAS